MVHPTWQRTKPGTDDEHAGWAFADADSPAFQSVTGHGSFPPKDVIPDPNLKAKYVRDLYEAVDDKSGELHSPFTPVPTV